MPLTKCWEKRVPSINPNALRKLEEIIDKDSKVFEYGTGGSTIWLAKRVGELIAVEHNKDWFRILKEGFGEELGGVPDNTMLMLRSGSPVLNGAWVRSETTGELIGLDYVDSILKYPDDCFNLVIVDGRARMSCLFNALSKVKRNGFICLDDSRRQYYRENLGMMADWKRTTYNGNDDTEYRGCQTIFFERLSENANI